MAKITLITIQHKATLYRVGPSKIWCVIDNGKWQSINEKNVPSEAREIANKTIVKWR